MAPSRSAGNGPALTVRGSASFVRSGRFAFPVGQTTHTVDVPGGVTTKSIVLASFQNALPYGTVSATRDVATGRITVRLDGPALAFPYQPIIGWMVVEVP